jgi:hypothetical protein
MHAATVRPPGEQAMRVVLTGLPINAENHEREVDDDEARDVVAEPENPAQLESFRGATTRQTPISFFGMIAWFDSDRPALQRVLVPRIGGVACAARG